MRTLLRPPHLSVVCLSIVAFISLLIGGTKADLMAQTQDVVLVGAGDIGQCGPGALSKPLATAALIDPIAGMVFVSGDMGYPNGLESDFEKCYAPTWGRFRSRSIPAPGHHEYIDPNGMGYYNYWGPTAGDPTKGYYSLNYGAWHIIVLNSECSDIHLGGCTATSPQGQWLQADLAANPVTCTLAIWHRTLYTSTANLATSAVQPFWQMLYSAGADLVINGHAHNYERFAPQDPNGNLDTAKGLREFIVGTGGGDLMSFTTVANNSQVRNSNTFGVLKLTLHATSYDWQFLPIAGQTFTDSGTQACH
ncbi:MAG TPA: metallophosphoesterase [Terriglobia bacterium]|nr:metallophosphoesterase [Terriglobia bacterium]